MAAEYCDVLTFVQSLAPTWRKTQHVMLAHLISALQERPSLSPTDIARALPPGPRASPRKPLHGWMKPPSLRGGSTWPVALVPIFRGQPIRFRCSRSRWIPPTSNPLLP